MINSIPLSLNITLSALVFGLYRDQYEKYITHKYDDIVHHYFVSLVVILCFISIIVEYNINYMDMSLLQTIILICASLQYGLDIGLSYKRKYMRTMDMYIHHCLGWIGIQYMLYYNIGGGMMVRLLLDVVTDYVREMKVSKLLFWFIYIFVRLVWYNYVLIKSLYLVYENNIYVNHIMAKYGLWFWLIFANYYHCHWMMNEYQKKSL